MHECDIAAHPTERHVHTSQSTVVKLQENSEHQESIENGRDSFVNHLFLSPVGTRQHWLKAATYLKGR